MELNGCGNLASCAVVYGHIVKTAFMIITGFVHAADHRVSCVCLEVHCSCHACSVPLRCFAGQAQLHWSYVRNINRVQSE